MGLLTLLAAMPVIFKTQLNCQFQTLHRVYGVFPSPTHISPLASGDNSCAVVSLFTLEQA